MFSALFASFVAWSFSPFFRDSGNGDGGGNGSAKSAEQQQQQQQQQRASSPPPPSASPAPILPAFLRDRLPAPRPPRFHTAVLYGRVLTTLCACQLLRALSFLSTSLPGPNYHCRAGSPAATLAMPRRWWGHLVVDVGEQATKGCGDLIFSSHTTFALVGCLAYAAFGNSRAVKAALWAAVAALSLLIVASRKHYTVDVVVAWYVVPLVWSFASRRWTTPERGSGGGGGAGGERPRGSGVGREGSSVSGGGGVGGGGGDGDKGGAKQRRQQQQQSESSKGRPFRHHPPSLIAAVSSSGPGFVAAEEGRGDVEEGGLSCGTCPSCGGATA